MRLETPLESLVRDLLGLQLIWDAAEQENTLKPLLENGGDQDQVERALDLAGLDAVEWGIIVRGEGFDGTIDSHDYLGALRFFSGNLEGTAACPRFICKKLAIAEPTGWDAVPMRGDYAKAFGEPPDGQAWHELFDARGARQAFDRVRAVYVEGEEALNGYAEGLDVRRLEVRVAIWMLRTQCLLLGDGEDRVEHATRSVEDYVQGGEAVDGAAPIAATY